VEHNVIAQGEFEKIAKLNPKERREIVDEIAGIKEYEEKKKEALEELGKVEQKLNDAMIVLKEREGVLIELEKEKKTALRFNSLKEEQRRLRGSLVISQYKKVEKEFEEYSRKVLDGNAKIEELNKEIDRLKAEAEEIDKKRREISEKINLIDTKNIYVEVERLRTAKEKNLEILNEKKKALDESTMKLKQLNSETKEIKEKLNSFSSGVRSLSEKVVELKKELEHLENERQNLVKSWEEKRKRLGSLDKELDELRERASVLKQEIARTSGTEKELAEKKSRKNELLKELEELKKKISENTRKADALFDEEKRANDEIKQLDSEILKLSERIVLSKADERSLAMLNELKKKFKIFGRVADLYSTKDEYALAISVAGGNRLNYIVVDSRETAIQAVKYLREKNLGRATFIPLDVISESEKATESRPGVLGKALDLISFDKKFTSVFEYVFGNTIIVENDDVLKQLSGRAVSLQGTLMESSGAITGGTPVRIAQRVTEDDLEKKKERRKELLDRLYEIKEMESNLRRVSAEYEIRKKEIEIELNSIDKIFDSSTVEKEADLQEIERKILDLQGEKERIRIAIENSEDEKEIGSIDEKILQLKTELSAAEAKLKSNEGIILQERLQKLEIEEHDVKEKVKSLSEEIDNIESEINEIDKKLAAKEEKIKSESAALEKLYSELKDLNSAFDNCTIETGKSSRKIEKIKEDLIRYSTLKEESQKKLIDLKYEADFYKDIEIIEESKEELERRIAEVEKELNTIGSVNLRAIELYDEKLRSYNEIKEKVSTLSNEKNSILKVIEEINSKKRDIFMKTYEEINKNFKNLTGNLFGNEGKLVLENEADPFEGGLDIMIKSGKKEISIESLSGGENSLLTLAFIFSIHFYKPSTFYILDEAESALDKENSKKLSQLIRSLSENAQFIIVTHNDAIMTGSEIALGITRDKNGSKLISLDLKKNT
jgi:chromosome segregation protein